MENKNVSLKHALSFAFKAFGKHILFISKIFVILAIVAGIIIGAEKLLLGAETLVSKTSFTNVAYAEGEEAVEEAAAPIVTGTNEITEEALEIELNNAIPQETAPNQYLNTEAEELSTFTGIIENIFGLIFTLFIAYIILVLPIGLTKTYLAMSDNRALILKDVFKSHNLFWKFSFDSFIQSTVIGKASNILIKTIPVKLFMIIGGLIGIGPQNLLLLDSKAIILAILLTILFLYPVSLVFTVFSFSKYFIVSKGHNPFLAMSGSLSFLKNRVKKLPWLIAFIKLTPLITILISFGLVSQIETPISQTVLSLILGFMCYIVYFISKLTEVDLFKQMNK